MLIYILIGIILFLIFVIMMIASASAGADSARRQLIYDLSKLEEKLKGGKK